MKNHYFLSHQPSLNNINQSLGVSSQYDFEKGVLVNIPVQMPEIKKSPTKKLPRLQKLESLKYFVLNSKQPNKYQRQKRQIPYQLIKPQPPPLGYYNYNESSFNQKSLVDMSKQSSARCQLRKMKSKSIDQEQQVDQQIQKENNKPTRINELSKQKLQEWITKELELLKENKRLEQTTYKGFMLDEKRRNDNFQRLFELTSLKLKNSYIKYFF